MYGYIWTEEYGIFQLSVNQKIQKEIRPVFKEELDFFGMDAYWSYPDTDAPILWAEGIRRYILNGDCVAEAKGGGFYTKPRVEVYRAGLQLQAVDVVRLWQVNQDIMRGLEQKAIEAIQKCYGEYAKEGYAFVVAFSGGKDSLALLELASRALQPRTFYVVFSDTGMELSCTLEAVEKAKRHWSSLRFEVAKSHLKPEDTWKAFGPPGRRMRWCCAVHKSIPTIMKLRELTGNYDVKAVVFDGVRAEESVRRAGYEEISVGAKNINQINCSPILTWSSSEVFLLLLNNGLLFNRAYRIGMNRVGCTICPLSSGWRDSLCNAYCHSEIEPLLKCIEDYVGNKQFSAERTRGYIESNGWRTRMGGRDLDNGGNRVMEMVNVADDTITFSFTHKEQLWKHVAPLLGAIVEKEDQKGLQLINRREFQFCISEKAVSYSPYSHMDRFVLSHLRGVANKVAYCIGCMACMAQCPTNAFVIKDGKIWIREDKCIHCCNCIDFTNGKGCLVAKSLSTTGGKGMDLKGMNRYQTFGLRKQWLDHYFIDGAGCFSSGQLGNRQYDALKVWLREAELLSNTVKGKKIGTPTELFEKLSPLGPYNPLTWAVIWTNLAYNSVICKWYMLNAQLNETYEKAELVFLLGDDYSLSTRDNAITALLETLRHSPIGSVLKQGISTPSGSSYRYTRVGWETPNAAAILYALYVLAEKTGRYSFTLSQLHELKNSQDAKGVDPAAIFGIDPSAMKDILQNLSTVYSDYVRVSFQVDLDNVHLDRTHTSLDIVALM